MNSTLKNMVLCLGAITLVASAGLAYIYSVTEGPIESARAAKTTAALAAVLPAFEGEPVVDTVMQDGIPVVVYSVSSGYAVQTTTKKAYSGEFKLMVGFLPDGSVHDIAVLQQNETPGLGGKISKEGNPLVLSFRGRKVSEMKLLVKKDGGDVDAITASTISSRAYVDAVERAYWAYLKVASKGQEASIAE